MWRGSFLILAQVSLSLMHLDIIAQEHVDLAAFEIFQDSVLLLSNQVRTCLDHVYLYVLQVTCKLTHGLNLTQLKIQDLLL